MLSGTVCATPELTSSVRPAPAQSATPVIAILKEIEALNRAKIPNRKILVLLAGKEQITDNVAVMQSIHRYTFINTATINKAQHEILIEKEEIRHKALSIIHEFLKS